MSGQAEMVAVDLPWGPTDSRTVVAAWSNDGQVSLTTLNVAGQVIKWIEGKASPGAVVALDIPIEGCESLGPTRPFRDVDYRLARLGIPILPSVKADLVGASVRDQLLQVRSDLHVAEIYPYATLRVLWAMKQEGLSMRLADGEASCHNQEWESWSRWPPKYKRAHSASDRRAALEAIAELLRDCGDEYAAVVRLPGSSTSDLGRVADEYDALLGLIAVRAAHMQSAWAWKAEVIPGDGAILTLAPAWLRNAFATIKDRRRKQEHRVPKAAASTSVAQGPPDEMTFSELSAELLRLRAACARGEAELRSLYLAIDKVTFGLRATRERIDCLTAEMADRNDKD